MAYWLLKTEPHVYSYSDLDRDGTTVWDGVANNLALKYIRTIQVGDLALIYHTGEERRAVGIARVISAPYPDPQHNDPKLVVFDLEKVAPLPQPVSLAKIKSHPGFVGFALLTNSRLSVVPVSPEHWQLLLQLANYSDAIH
ncbi:MAG: EVE domain-containing protein [Pseudanabaenaceae cyanobacterium SKYGB_i_bin29]|nr:EVE domain-containing protein [Pseudanabaenaceae cyanobacterium SKYG29]MDW8421250.1 EVE domain-containing protein [Pseudanabaenaceae cyanobacterium SKYGB_i_bin29]